MLERADRIALKDADPRPCLTFQSEWSLGQRRPHPAKLARDTPGTEKDADGTWLRTFDALRFSTIVGRGPPQLDQVEHQSTGVYKMFEDMLQAQGLRNSIVPAVYLV